MEYYCKLFTLVVFLILMTLIIISSFYPSKDGNSCRECPRYLGNPWTACPEDCNFCKCDCLGRKSN